MCAKRYIDYQMLILGICICESGWAIDWGKNQRISGYADLFFLRAISAEIKKKFLIFVDQSLWEYILNIGTGASIYPLKSPNKMTRILMKIFVTQKDTKKIIKHRLSALTSRQSIIHNFFFLAFLPWKRKSVKAISWAAGPFSDL